MCFAVVTAVAIVAIVAVVAVVAVVGVVTAVVVAVVVAHHDIAHDSRRLTTTSRATNQGTRRTMRRR